MSLFKNGKIWIFFSALVFSLNSSAGFTVKESECSSSENPHAIECFAQCFTAIKQYGRPSDLGEIVIKDAQGKVIEDNGNVDPLIYDDSNSSKPDKTIFFTVSAADSISRKPEVIAIREDFSKNLSATVFRYLVPPLSELAYFKIKLPRQKDEPVLSTDFKNILFAESESRGVSRSLLHQIALVKSESDFNPSPQSPAQKESYVEVGEPVQILDPKPLTSYSMSRPEGHPALLARREILRAIHSNLKNFEEFLAIKVKQKIESKKEAFTHLKWRMDQVLVGCSPLFGPNSTVGSDFGTGPAVGEDVSKLGLPLMGARPSLTSDELKKILSEDSAALQETHRFFGELRVWSGIIGKKLN